jgi:hypothetical protein
LRGGPFDDAEPINALTRGAVDQAETTGLLAASPGGAGLYASLGWDTTLEMWSLMGVADG